MSLANIITQLAHDANPAKPGFQPSGIYVVICLVLPIIIGVIAGLISNLVLKILKARKNRGTSGGS